MAVKTSSKRFYFFRDTDFSEFVFNVIDNLTFEQKAKLSSTDLEYLKTKGVRRRFADYETIDKQLYLLSRVGIKFCILVGTEDKVGMMLEEVENQYATVEGRADVIKLMAENKTFALSSRHVMEVSNMAAQNSHSQIYMLDRKYLQMRDQLNEAGTSFYSKDIEQSKRAITDLGNLALATISAIEKVEVMFNMDTLRIKILLALYKEKNNYVTIATVSSHIGESIRGCKIKNRLLDLCKNGYADKLSTHIPTSKKDIMSFTITENGIEKVGNFIKYLSKFIF